MWYNRLPSDVLVTDIWPNRSYRRGQEQVTVMNLDYFPKERGPYNYSLDVEATLLTQPPKNWTGIMKFLGGTGANILEQNINYIEIWMKAEDIPGQAKPNLQRGRLYLNLGKISEDVIPNKKLNSEDLVKGNLPYGILNPGEDVGLDMLTDEQERSVYAALIAKYPELNSDPSGDNWIYHTGGGDFSRINGTEGNEMSAEGRFPDTEDLNANGDVDLINSYLEYEIPLDTVYVDSVGNVRPNELIVGGGSYGWHQFRIPLTDFTRKVATGNEQPVDILQNVQYVRIWVSGFDEPVRVRIADIGLVGNQWQEVTKTDTILKVTVVNIEDNPAYHSPPGVIRERDRTQPDQEILGNEQSLNLKINGLADGQSREAFKNYPRGLDVFNYKTMKMFVHGDAKFNYTDTSNYDAEIYLRFGYDSLNYYEYRAPIHPGWDPPNNEIVISFAELSAVKEGRDSIRFRSKPVPVKGGPPGAVYIVLGNPALTNIRFFWVGVENPVSKGTMLPLYGEVWINELRVADVDDTPGWAYRFNTQLKIADFGNASFNMERVDPFFHGLDQRFGRRETGTNWAVSANFALERFFPSSWQGTSLPFTYTHTENVVNPLYLPNTDIKVDQAAQRASEAILQRGGTQAQADSIKKQIIAEAQTIRTSDAFAVPSLRIALPSDAWYIRETINKLGWSFSYNRSTERNPMIAERISWAWRGGGNYAVSLPADFYIAPFAKIFNGVYLLDDFKNYKIFFIPITGFNAGVSAQRGQTREVARVQSALRPITRNFSASRSLSFGWKLTEGGLTNISGDYSLSIESILMHLETDSAGNQRPIKQILRDIFSTNKIINFGRDARYGQRLQINSKPKIPNILDVNKYLDFTLSYSVNYGWQNNFQQGDIGKSAGFDNNLNFSSNFRLKALTDPWFAFKAEPTESDRLPIGGFRGKPRKNRNDSDRPDELSDTTAFASQDTMPKPKSGINIIAQLKTLAKIFIKYPVLDYETINITYSQTNRAGHSGVRGSTGLMNMWGV
ncbi:MAG: cell surface protein SprA, partial [Bacteroidetes bacterium]|nr:cell surface protein SprA [Bacteroidota bacterium]